MTIELVPFSEAFLNLTWKWLNDPEIKKTTNTPTINKNDQITWFKSLSERTDYIIWGIAVNNTPIGACGLKNINKEECEYWGYIGEKSFWGKRIGTYVLNVLLDHARNKNKSSVYLTVLKDNQRAINLYTKFGFYTEKEVGDNLLKMRLAL